jgi:hypothetical protein
MKAAVAAAVAAALLLAVAAPADAALRLPKPSGKCSCRTKGGIPNVFKPVCGADFNTYGNECVAKCANVLIRSNGPCAYCNIKVGDCNCGRGYNPVCSFGLTFSTPCDAACGGYTCPMDPGVCRYNPNGSRTKSPAPKNTNVAGAANNQNMPSTSAARYSYTKAIHLSLIFFESMRSGKLNRQRLAWRSDSCLKCRGPSGENLSKGYYEAGGSFLKLGLVEAFLVTVLADGVLQFPTGFKKSGDLQNAIDAIEWGADYLMAAHSKPDRFVAVLGNDTLDFDYYGSVERYDTYVKKRTTCYIDSKNRGSEIAGEAAAALAAASMVYKANGVKRDTKAMIVHAKQLYSLATKYPGSYASASDTSCLGIHKRLYASSNGYTDELAWAAAWLFRATGEARFRNDAKKYYNRLPQPPYAFETGNKVPALTVMMQTVDPANSGKYFGHAQGFFRPYLQQIIQHTPAGLAYPYHFGALRPTTQMAFLALKQSKNLRSRRKNLGYAAQLFNYAAFQINYVLGDGGRSWLGGYSSTSPKYWWHKQSYNSYITEPLKGLKVYANIRSEKTNGKYQNRLFVEAAKFDMEGSFRPQRFTPYGALYGAPLGDDSIVVGRKDYSYAEPTTDGNAAVTGAFAALAEYFGSKQGAQNDCGLDLGWTAPSAKLNSRSINNTRICAARGL